MKTDEQMTNDILTRVAARKETQRHRNRICRRVTGGLLSLLIAVGAIFGWNNLIPKKPEPVASPSMTAESDTAAVQRRGLSLLVADAASPSAEEAVPTAHGTNISLPVHGYLAVYNITDFSRGRIEELNRENMSRARELGIEYGGRAAQTEDHLFHFVLGEQFAVRVEDADALESLTLCCGGTGVIEPHASLYANGGSNSVGFSLSAQQESKQTLCLTGEQYREFFTGDDAPACGLRFQWFLSEETKAAFDADPAMTPAQVADEITVTALYADGASESFSVRIGFTEDGTLTASYSDCT